VKVAHKGPGVSLTLRHYCPHPPGTFYLIGVCRGMVGGGSSFGRYAGRDLECWSWGQSGAKLLRDSFRRVRGDRFGQHALEVLVREILKTRWLRRLLVTEHADFLANEFE
jgi:hypothetical protein